MLSVERVTACRGMQCTHNENAVIEHNSILIAAPLLAPEVVALVRTFVKIAMSASAADMLSFEHTYDARRFKSIPQKCL